MMFIDKIHLDRAMSAEGIGVQPLTAIHDAPAGVGGQIVDELDRPAYGVVLRGPMMFYPPTYGDVTVVIDLEVMAALICEMTTAAESAGYGPALTHMVDQAMVDIRKARAEAEASGETGLEPKE